MTLVNPSEDSLTQRNQLAFRAIGGRKWKGVYCMCDPDVGATPCQYCAEYSALVDAEWMIGRIGELEGRAS